MTQQPTARVLVVDDHEQARTSIADILRLFGHQVTCCASAVEALSRLEESNPEVILTDLQMPGMDGLAFIRSLSERGCEAQVVMLTAYASVATAVDAMRLGAFDYIEKPFHAEKLEQVVLRALRQGVGKRSSIPAAVEAAMIGSSRLMGELRQKIAQIAATSETVLIHGESGTGKELVAKAIHAASPRRERALVSVNCPALSPQLMESELFGHERGAFTSADAHRIGRFELAEGGTILLDEVTEIDLPLQAKLLRVLQERSYERVGSSRTTAANVRVLAATNRDLHREVQNGRFRQDLYYRLAVVPVAVPPLRERREDLPELVAHFSQLATQRIGGKACELDSTALELLHEHPWPGNVRELENIVTRANVLFGGRPVSAEILRPWFSPSDAPAYDAVTPSESPRATTNAQASSGVRLDDMERQLIESTLERFDGHRERTAKALGIGVRTLSNKLRQYGYSPRTKVFARAG